MVEQFLHLLAQLPTVFGYPLEKGSLRDGLPPEQCESEQDALSMFLP